MLTKMYLRLYAENKTQACAFVSLSYSTQKICHPLSQFTLISSFSQKGLSQDYRQNLCGSDCFILGTEDPVIKSSDTVASTAADRHQCMGFNQNGFGGRAIEWHYYINWHLFVAAIWAVQSWHPNVIRLLMCQYALLYHSRFLSFFL